jgi:predicted secreted protein
MGGLALDIAMYVVIWWIVLFAVLPFGVKPAREGELGHDAGAPQKPYLLAKAGATTLVAALVWVLVHWAMVSELAKLRNGG